MASPGVLDRPFLARFEVIKKASALKSQEVDLVNEMEAVEERT